MFTSLTSYLFGSGAEEETLNTQANTIPPAEAETTPSRLKEATTEDEWVLIDKSRGSSTDRLEQNPMENLLIEHPSMSVYGPRLRQNSAGIESNHSDSSDDHPPPSTSRKVATKSRPAPVRSSPRRPRAVAARAGLSSNQQTVKAVQVACRRENKRQLSAKQLTRNNKVRQAECRRVRQRSVPLLMQPGTRACKRC